MPAASLVAAHESNRRARQISAPLRTGSCTLVPSAGLSSGPSVKPLSFAKERTLAVAREIGWGQGGKAKRERLATVLGIASPRISRAFSPNYPDTLKTEYLDALIADARGERRAA